MLARLVKFTQFESTFYGTKFPPPPPTQWLHYFLEVLRQLFNSLNTSQPTSWITCVHIIFNSVGSHADTVGSTKCEPCKEGYYQTMFGQKSCEPCDVGKWCRWNLCLQFALSNVVTVFYCKIWWWEERYNISTVFSININRGKMYTLSRINILVCLDVHTVRSVTRGNMPNKKVLLSVKCVKLVHINPTQDRPSVFRVPMEPRQGTEFILH